MHQVVKTSQARNLPRMLLYATHCKTMGELWDVLLQPVRRTEQGDWDPDDLEERHKFQSQVFVKQCCYCCLSDVQEDELDELDEWEEDPEGQGQTDKDNPPALLTAHKAEKAGPCAFDL